MTNLQKAIYFCGSFEAEALLLLMMRQWNHPKASDPEARNEILERAAEVLQVANRGESPIPELKPADMNLIAAIWFAEWCQAQGLNEDEAPPLYSLLDAVRKAIPSCFVDPDQLP